MDKYLLYNESEQRRLKIIAEMEASARIEKLKYVKSLYNQGLNEEQVNKNLSNNNASYSCEFAERPAEKIHDYHYKMEAQYSGKYGSKSDW